MTEEGIPGVDRKRRLFEQESVRHCLTEEWKTVQDITADIFPDYKSFEAPRFTKKIRHVLIKMLKDGEIEKQDSGVRIAMHISWQYRRVPKEDKEE